MSSQVFKAFTGASKVGQARPQSVLTPPYIVERLLRFWPDGIDLDPCSCDGSLVPAKEQWRGPGYEPKGTDWFASFLITKDGLKEPWFGSVFVNEPYNDLHAWLSKCKVEAERGVEIINLCPWRSRRKWFRAAYRDADAVMLLDPVTFYDSTTCNPWRSKKGQITQFPENCCLLYWGERRAEFRGVFCALGDPL